MQKSREVVVAKGKKHTTFTPDESNRDEIISGVMGRSGNLRAPTLKVGDIYVVGFNDDLYRELLVK